MATVQLVIGPPGSGKSTYCSGMKQFLSSMGRSVSIVNLDPANESLPYESSVDIKELINLEEVMERLGLGPNGGLMYCMEYLDTNSDWLLNKMTTTVSTTTSGYYLIDCPGQVELYTCHSSLKSITNKLTKANMKVVSVHIVDSQHCTDPAKYISVLLSSLSSMLQIELPHINILSKVDLLKNYDLPFHIDYYTEVQDLSHIVSLLSDRPFFKRYKALNEIIMGLIEDYSLVNFIPLSIQDKESMLEAVKSIDRASGYIMSQNERDTSSSYNNLMSGVFPADYQYTKNMTIREELMEN